MNAVSHLSLPGSRNAELSLISVERGNHHSIDEAVARAAAASSYLRSAWYEGDARLAETICLARADGRAVLALPLVRSGPLGCAAEVPGCYWPYRSFPIAADVGDLELETFLDDPRARRALGRVWRVGPLREDDPVNRRFARAALKCGWTVLQRRLGTSFILNIPVLRESGAWPRNSTLRKNRFFEKHLRAEGPLDFRFVTGSDWSSAVFDELAAIEGESWIARETNGGDAKFLWPKRRAFWEAAASDPVLAGMMWAAILKIGGRPVAFSFDLDCGSTRYAIANSYDQRYARRSPGRVLAYRSFERLADRGVSVIDWGSGDPGYKKMMGAVPGPGILDLMFVAGRPLAQLICGLSRSGPRWEMR